MPIILRKHSIRHGNYFLMRMNKQFELDCYSWRIELLLGTVNRVYFTLMRFFGYTLICYDLVYGILLFSLNTYATTLCIYVIHIHPYLLLFICMFLGKYSIESTTKGKSILLYRLETYHMHNMKIGILIAVRLGTNIIFLFVYYHNLKIWANGE